VKSLSILFFILLSLSHQADDVAELLEKGEDYLASQRYEDAVGSFKAVLRKDPLNGTALFNLGYIYENFRGDEKLGSLYWNRYKASSYVSLGDASAGTGDLDEAVVQYKKALGLVPESGIVHGRLGAVYRRMGKEGEALEEYETAANLEPRNVNLYLRLWQYLSEKGEAKKATFYLEKAVESQSADPALRRKALDFYNKIGKEENALEQIAALSQAGQATKEEHRRLGNHYLKSGKLDEAWRELCAGFSREEREESFKSAAVLADTYRKKGEQEKAKEVYRSMLRAGCHDPAVFNALVTINQTAGDTDAALEFAEAGVGMFPGSAAMHNNLATLIAIKGDYVRAVAEYRKALEIDPGLAEAYLDIGIIFKDYLKDNGKAAEAFKRYVELKPEGKDLPEVAALLKPVKGTAEHKPLPGDE
jgi:protein O-GlcNAc transferase